MRASSTQSGMCCEWSFVCPADVGCSKPLCCVLLSKGVRDDDDDVDDNGDDDVDDERDDDDDDDDGDDADDAGEFGSRPRKLLAELD